MTGGASQSTALEFNDIPRYSEWPKRLLSLTPFGVKYKTEKEVLREYQDEKWAELLRYARTLERPTLAEIERHHVDFDALSPGFDDGVFVLANEQAMLDKHLALYAGVLKPHLEGASCLVELGAGFGSKLLGLAHMEGFADIPLGACEFTQNGR